MQKNNALRWLLPCCLILLAMTGLANADESMTVRPIIPDNVTSGELELAQARNMVLEQKVQTARLQQQLRQAEAPAETKSGTEGTFSGYSRASVVAAPLTQTVDESSVSRVQGLVHLQEIYGKPGALRARITLPGGGVMEVKQGDIVPGMKGKVTLITGEAVRLSDGSDLTF